MEQIKFKNPEIRVIGLTDQRDNVWRISRPHLKVTDRELMDIRKLDLPIHSFAFVIFEITGSILLRDVLYHVRPTSDWARSNRTTVINKDTLLYSAEYCDSNIDEERWRECVDESTSLDLRKDKFPYMVSTDFCWGCDLRTFATAYNSMKAELPGLYSVYGVLFKKALEEAGIEKLPPGRIDYFSSLSIKDIDSLEDASEPKIEIDDRFDTVMIQYRGKGSLLSQFIRQHIARVRSGLITRLLNVRNIWDTSTWSQDELFDMQVVTTIEGAQKLISTRACYFAKFDMDSRSSWSDIVSSLIKKSGGSLIDYIPCKGDCEKCPWKTEQLARCIAGNPTASKGEVNPPCPYITGVPESIAIRKAKFGSNSSLFKLWEEMDIPFNPTKYGEQYLKNVHDYGFAEACDNENDEMKKIAEDAYNKLN